MVSDETRYQALRDWAAHQLGIPEPRLEPASVDASFRRYLRVRSGRGSYIIMDAPPTHEDVQAFAAVTARLEAGGLHVPHVYAADLSQGFLLLEDLGTTQYLTALDSDNADALYGDALEALAQMQATPAQDLPAYDRPLLLREMALFRDWFLARHLGVDLDGSQVEVLEAAFEGLAQAALEQPRLFVHRDYHSRNLMVTTERNPGILDHQDAVLGPVSYDLVSLLRDCYIAWPSPRVRAWARRHRDRLVGDGLLPSVDMATFQRWLDLMGIQRHLKAIGIFARLYHRDGKPGYLRDIPRTLDYVLDIAPDYPETRPLYRLLTQLEISWRLGG